MTHRVFFSGTKNASSWALRAWLALRAANVSFVETIVDIRKPQRYPNLAKITRFSPAAQVPVLVVDGVAIFDSLAIMEYANDCSGGALLPQDPIARAQARAVVAWQHGGLSNICQRISFESAFYPYKRELSADEVSECARVFNWLEELLLTFQGQFLFGNATLADFALVPLVVRLTRHGMDFAGWPRTGLWAEVILNHSLVREWLDHANKLPHIWDDSYLIPGAPVELIPAEHLHPRLHA